MDGITLLEYIGVFAFAISGANVAIEEELDLLGIYILGIVTAMGGGIIRDIVTKEGIPVFFHSYSAIIVIFIATTLAIFLKGKWKDHRIMIIIDAVGLGAFFVSSGVKAIDNEYNFVLFLFVTSITGVGGGLLRDIITNRKPVVLQSDIYCIAGIIGVIILRTLYPYIGHTFVEYFSLAIIVIIRIVCYSKNINLPKVNYHYKKADL
ncbi:MAG TPA: TRIC cation channel family protein [Lachnospiraceae bacterium]|nr:TRIC cation channel family protein [Lachnospiraceae bacterium]